MDNDVVVLIKKRHSSRMPYDPAKPLNKEDLDKILEAANWSPTAHNMQNFEMIIVDDKSLLEKIGNISGQISADFIRENCRQMSFTPEELQKKKTGILGTMFPEAWRDPHADFDKLAAESAPSPLKNTMKNCPALIIVTYDVTKRAPASEGDILGFISLGCVMENMWLVAEKLGIGLQIMSVFSGKKVEEELKKMLGIPEKMKIAYAVRLGYPLNGTTNYLRVRRELPDFIHHNGY